MTAPTPSPFTLFFPDAALDELKVRLAATRWPDEPPLEPWSTGTSVAYLRTLVDYWRTGFDWRVQEQHLNAFRQFRVPLAGIDLHFIHEPGVGPQPMPLLLSHGWPGSVFEFVKLIPLLTNPAAHGGDARDAFTVVAPSLPGYTLSFKPNQQRFGVEEIADTFAQLMTEVLGYARFAAQGGDWGAFITSRLGYKHAKSLTGIHVNLLAVRRDQKTLDNPTTEEKDFLGQLDRWLKEEVGYQWIQGTRPQTLAFGLSDSPVGLAAWLVEKFRAWTDNDGNPESALTRDEMLADITLYWLTGCIGASFWPYYTRRRRPWPIPEGAKIDVPMGYAEFPKEILSPPRSLAEGMYSDIRRWTRMPKGGHFAAMEQPALLAHEIREFFRPLRSQA
jgi:microsomal epoxide hydrolase